MGGDNYDINPGPGLIYDHDDKIHEEEDDEIEQFHYEGSLHALNACTTVMYEKYKAKINAMCTEDVKIHDMGILKIQELRKMKRTCIDQVEKCLRKQESMLFECTDTTSLQTLSNILSRCALVPPSPL